MPLLRNGQWSDENPWIRLEDDAPYPASDNEKPLLCSLKRFIELQSEGLHQVSGVWLNPDDDVMELSEHLQRIQLIVIEFPKYTDGRGYSHARMLRKQLGFSGELRANGDIRSDQLLFMMRAGLDSFEFPERPDNALIKQILTRYRVNYQPSYELPVAG